MVEGMTLYWCSTVLKEMVVQWDDPIKAVLLFLKRDGRSMGYDSALRWSYKAVAV